MIMEENMDYIYYFARCQELLHALWNAEAEVWGQRVLGCGGLCFKIAAECSGNFIINAYKTLLFKKMKRMKKIGLYVHQNISE